MENNYNHIRRQLPREIFRPYWPRLFPILFVFGLGVFAVVAICTLGWPWYGQLALALLVGYCWSIGGLFAHEILHGSVVRSRIAQDILGFFCFLPYLISPTFWRYWHNNLHHSHTQKIIMDPDAFPTLKIFKQSRFAQWMFPYTPGSRHKRSYLYLFYWFSLNAHVVQHYLRYRNKTFQRLSHLRVNFELALAFIIHLTFLILVGPENWLWAVFVPFLFMNYLPFSYISTNHNLSPLTKHNDPLANSLTVTNFSLLEYLHLNFGYHVEHHLFPTLSGVHLKKVHRLLKNEHPDKYCSMPKWKAIRQLYRTPRVYKNSTTLIHPESGQTYPVVSSGPTETHLSI